LQSISPGLVKTEMPPQQILESLPYLNPEDIADGVLYVLGTPPHVQVRRSSARQPWQVVNIFDIRYRPRPFLSKRDGGEDHAFGLTVLSWRRNDKVPPTYCCVGTKLHGVMSQKMATVKCNFIYSHSVIYIDDTLTV